MKLTKEIEERIQKEIEDIEREKKEGKIVFYSQEEFIKMLFEEKPIEKTI